MIPIMWVLNLSAVLCWFTTDNWTRGFKAFEEDILDIVGRAARSKWGLFGNFQGLGLVTELQLQS